MDKKSNRTDLLAAGHKKLEQYRQKNSKGKDGKGKHVKGSSSKSKSRADNSEQRDDDESVMPTSTNAPTEASQLPEIAHHLNPESDSSTSVPLNNTEDSTSNEPIDNAIPVPVLDDKGNDKAPSLGVADPSLDDSDDVKTSSSSKEMEKLSIDPIDGGRSAFGIPMLEAANDDPYPSTTSSSSGACADEDNRPPVPVEVDVMKKEDQVSSDVGAMQEVHGSGSKDNDRSMRLGEQEVANLSVPLMENSSRAGESDTPCSVTDVQHDMKEDYGNVASGFDGQAVTLMKLVDVIKGLSEDDFMFLINSRSLVNSNKLPVQTEYSDVFAVLQEHLYVTNISKEFSLLQLFEASKHENDLDHKHRQLGNEISVLTASFDDANERNTCLYAELAECRSELKAAICEKEELQSQCCSADEEVKELSSKVDELRVIIEESSTNLSKLSEELDCCKNQLADSLAENERLVNTLSSIAEENNKDMELKEQLLDEKLSMELAGCMSSIAALQVMSIKNGSWDSIYDTFQSFDELGCADTQSNKRVEYECLDVELGGNDPPCSTDHISDRGLRVTVEEIIRKVAEYFATESPLSRDGLSPAETITMVARKLLHCEVWLNQQFSVKNFDSLGYGEYLTFLERNISQLPKELHGNLNSQVHGLPFEVCLLEQQLDVLVSQASDNLWEGGTLSKHRIANLLSRQFPFINFNVVEKGCMHNS